MTSITRLAFALLLAVPLAVTAQDAQRFSQAELDQMLAPVALYPDAVLSHILIASTYPLEIVQAARWVRQNPGVEGEQAVAMVENRDWDESVKALVAFPNLIERMDEDLDWTERLGYAFLVQESQVLDTIQGLRRRADTAGKLESAEHVRVVREQETIVIEPARTRVVYVPYYDTRVVYGPWWWSAHPPVYWAPPYGYYHTSIGFHWGRPVHVAPAFWFSAFHWPHRHVVVVHHRHHFHSSRDVVRHRDAKRWRHKPRRGFRDSTAGPATRVAQRSAQREWADDRRQNMRMATTAPRDSRASQSDRTARSSGRESNSAFRTQTDTRRQATTQRPSQRPADTTRSAPTFRSQSSAPRTTGPAQRAATSRAAPSRAAPSRAAPSRAPRPPVSSGPSSRAAAPRHSAPAASAPSRASRSNAAPRQSAPRQSAPRASRGSSASPQSGNPRVETRER